ncbi:MAG: hypothetical protein Q9220_000215 [cf. Caloplaca sp. 1 TL-2023]
MSELTKDEARKFIAEVREANGGLSVEERDFLAEKMPSVLRALRNTRRQLADSIKIVVDNLYSKETRFLYELIQNAEDNSYSTATANGEEPFLTFKVYPECIVVDSNEDGFSESNIRAISSVGNSTKKQSAGYIGEKGIGFKSVFKIAQKVHIQSGQFSFAFSHTREDDDDGLGMITPFHEDPKELPFRVRTRMTLTLLDSTKFEERASEFRNVPDTLLMFLSQLQRLSIELYAPGSNVMSIQYSKRETREHGLYATLITKIQRHGEQKSTSEQKYYIVKNDLHELPIDEARKDKQGKYIQRATVILAFPVDEHDEPVLKQQYTYAFLPLRQVGFNFLIQADFVTQANREGVVHSTRNEAILRGVAKAFADAMESFCKSRSLIYRWMRYLPLDSISDEFWRLLWPLIRGTLMQRSLLEPWSGDGRLYKPPELEKLSEEFLTKDGNPLLPDLENKPLYLSSKYTEEDFQILGSLGTTMLRWKNFVDRLEIDLKSGSNSKWKDLTETGDWRTRICKLVTSAFAENLDDQKRRLSTLALIPLCDRTWISTASMRIFFPDDDGISIPRDLGVNLVDVMASKNTTWADLLRTLGVESGPRDGIITLILRRYNAINLGSFKVSHGVSHVRYLYWFLKEDQLGSLQRVRLANQNGYLLRADQYLYFPDKEDDYSPKNLFQQDDLRPGHPVNFLHEDYLKAVGTEIIHNDRSWSRWLEEFLGVLRVAKIRAENEVGMSKEFKYITTYQSSRLLGTLKKGWDSYGVEMHGPVQKELRNSAVLLANGRRAPLQATYLPFPKLRKITSELQIIDQYPFVALYEPLRDEAMLDWMFVKDLQIGMEENLGFYLSALETYKTMNPALNTTSATDQLTRIYRNIELRCTENLDRVRDTFKRPVIWMQSTNRVDSTWLSTAECVWNGPQWLMSKQCLKQDLYLALEHLFKVSLELRDASQVDILTDLQILKARNWDKGPLDHHETTSAPRNTGIDGPKYQVTISNSYVDVDHLQSITCMDVYKSQSFEELRLKNFAARAPSTIKSSINESKASFGIQTDQVLEEVEKRYEYLRQKHSSSANDEDPKSRETLRFTFEHSALVYIPREKSWRSPSQCVWVESNARIPRKACIADAYPLKKTFFTKILNISEPTVWMYMDALIDGANGKVSAVQVKETMALICRLGVGKSDLSTLIEAAFLPIKLANGRADFASASSGKSMDFAILDNALHRDSFRGKTNVLDMTLEEIRDTKPLLLAMGLENRFSSRLVREITNVNGGSQDYNMTRNIRIKSRAIIRSAVHFTNPDNRPDVTSTYRLYKRAIVYVSDGIRRSLQIVQDGRCIEGVTSRANFHLKQSEGAIHLYLPRNEVERDVCLESDLPRQMCTFLQITDPSASAIIGAVIRKDNTAVIDMILASAGVGQVDFDFVALDEELRASTTDSDAETLVEPTSNINLSTPVFHPRSSTPSSSAAGREQRSDGANVENTPIVRDRVTPSSSYLGWQASDQATAYQRILENVVNTARQRARSNTLESTGAAVFSSSLATPLALSQDTIREAFRTQDRDFQIGAAGELYIFELLKGLCLPGFNLKHWTSGIRNRVKSHADYLDIENNNDRDAIADIEYLDHSGSFTRYLVQRGHLAQGLWDDERPHYHIEVKTTLSSDWQEPFFMSKAQERHIQGQQIINGKSRSSIYMICRVFNLGKGDMTGMNIYVDPESKRRNQQLEFSTHTWAVKPLAHQLMQGSMTPSARSTPNPQTTGGSLFAAAVQPSSSTTTGSLFGAATTPRENNPLQNTSGTAGFGTPTPRTYTAFGMTLPSFGSGPMPSDAQARRTGGTGLFGGQTTSTGSFGAAVQPSSSNTTSLFSTSVATPSGSSLTYSTAERPGFGMSSSVATPGSQPTVTSTSTASASSPSKPPATFAESHPIQNSFGFSRFGTPNTASSSPFSTPAATSFMATQGSSSTGLFSFPTATSSTATQGSLFGSSSSTPAATSSTAKQGSLFANLSSTPSTAKQGSLFANLSSTPSTATQGSLFSNLSSTTAATSSTATQGSLFSNLSSTPAATSSTATQGSLFGQLSQNVPRNNFGGTPSPTPITSGLFGSSAPTNQSTSETSSTSGRGNTSSTFKSQSPNI